MWLAPNLITLLGTMGLVLGYAASAYYLPEFEGVHATTAFGKACRCDGRKHFDGGGMEQDRDSITGVIPVQCQLA